MAGRGKRAGRGRVRKSSFLKKRSKKLFINKGLNIMITIRGDRLTARIDPLGAELTSLKDSAGYEFIWQAGPAWPRHSPALFPIVGQVNNDQYRVDNKTYHLTRHGFARDRLFETRAIAADRASFVLTDSAATRELYPFAFNLTYDYAVKGASLRISISVQNPGTESLPFSIGAHPAFNWPPSARRLGTDIRQRRTIPGAALARRPAGAAAFPDPDQRPRPAVIR